MRSSRNKTALDVEEELRFHLESLERKYLQHGLSPAEAKTAAARRFGNLESVKQRCVHITRRNSLQRRILKASSIVMVLIGLSIHFLSSDRNVAHIGETLIMIGIAGRLLLYVHGLRPTPRNYEKPECW
jgi:hypothetical protein